VKKSLLIISGVCWSFLQQAKFAFSAGRTRKISLLAITTFLCLIKVSYSQDVKLPIDTSTHKVSYSAITIATGIKQKELYSKAKQWVVYSYKSAKDAIQMDDPDNGKLILKGFVAGDDETFRGVLFTYNIYYTITISIKDGKYKVNISDFEREMISDGKTLAKIPIETTLEHLKSGNSDVSKEETDKMYFGLKSNINKVALNIIESFKSAMSKKDEF